MSGGNGQEKSQQPVKPTVPPERATIKLKVIPTDIIEKLLGKYIKQINDTYRQVQGDIPINKSDNDDTSVKSNSRKRTIAEVNETFDNKIEFSERLKYSNEQLPLYGFSPTEISSKPTRTNQPISDALKLPVLEIMKTSIKYNHKEDKEICISEDTLALMNEWAEQFLHLITKRLVRLMEIQRRRLPNRDDLKLLLREGYIDNEGLNQMYILSQQYFKTENNKINEVDKKAQLALSAFSGTDDGIFNNNAANDDNLVTEEPWWIDQLIHRKKRKSYIPEWMPPLPPDYTYKSTPKFSQRITNPVLLREKLVQEGRLGEKALDHIIINKDDNTLASPLLEDESVTSSEDEINEKKNGVEKIDSIVNDKTENGTGIPILTNTTENDKPATDITNDVDLMGQKNKNEKGDDIVELAKKRMAILEKRRKEEDERYLSRVESDESKFGRNFGFYTKVKKLPEGINDVLNEYRHNKFKHLIHNLYKQEKKNAQWAIEQEELRKKIAEEKSKYAEANEIQLGVGNSNANDANSGFFYGNDDEDVDFDVEFSDMEEVEDIQHNEKPSVSTEPIANASEESREVSNAPLLAPVSVPQETGTEATSPLTPSTYATNNSDFNNNNTNNDDLQVPPNSMASVESHGHTGERVLSVRFQDDIVDIPSFSNNDQNTVNEEEEEEIDMEDFEEEEFEEL